MKEMNEKMLNLALGKRIKKMRLERGLTREQLLDLLQQITVSDFLAHVTSIRRIEDSETSLKVKNLLILAHVLQVDLKNLLANLPGMPEEEEEEEEEEEVRHEIMHLINLVEYDKVAKLAAQLASENNKQFKLWCEGFLANRQQQDKTLARQKLLQALRLTLPSAFHKKKGTFLADKLDGLELNWLECQIWMELANLLPAEEGLGAYERLFEKIEQSRLFSDRERHKMLAGVCYNLTVCLLKGGVVDSRVADYCYRGILIELEAKQHVYLGGFYYSLGRYHVEQKNVENAKKFFQRSDDFFNVMQNFVMAEKMYEMVKKVALF